MPETLKQQSDTIKAIKNIANYYSVYRFMGVMKQN